jgi:hypothetical protein
LLGLHPAGPEPKGENKMKEKEYKETEHLKQGKMGQIKEKKQQIDKRWTMKKK